MAEQEPGVLVKAAKAIGKAAGKVAAVAGVEPEKPADAPDLYKAQYIGSGTFIIKKPKRNRTKLHQTRVKSRRRGMRK
ncbi:MAG TPA: hypothetical protein VMZ52_06370 [Bryobacteraceae bacterium]|nr:hypothetical protein [Bryobacteraceae bacterium]